MRWSRIGLALITLASVAACAAAPRTQEDYVSRVQVKDSEFDSSVTYVGPQLQASSEGFGGTSTYARFRSVRGKTSGRVEHQLYVDIYYSGTRPRFFERAAFPGGSSVDVDVIRQERLRCHKKKILWPCDFQEILGIPLSNRFLMEHRETGFRTRLNAQSGDEVIVEVPAHFVNGQFEAMNLR